VSSDAIRRAVEELAAGRLVAYPTETVWGLGADAARERAVARLRAWKGRDDGKPIAVLVEGAEALAPLGIELPPAAAQLARRFWPGPLTLVLPARAQLAAGIARADGALGVRCSPHPVAQALARAARERGLGPVTATSLNRTREPPARSAAEARALCAGPGAPWVVDAGREAPAPAEAQPSSVVDCTAAQPEVLRVGAISEAQIRAVCEDRPLR
jgi:L-threonylcarbamoyladenylate synthase